MFIYQGGTMNVNFELYKTFYHVAKYKNITKAANEMHISQPGVSKSIKTLENQLNCKLFVRNKKGVTLTEEGITLYKSIKIAMELISNAEDKILDMTNLEYGIINIGISKTLTENYLLPYLDKFHEKYPNIKINIHTDYTELLIGKVRNGIVDFIINNLPYNMPLDFETEPLKKVDDCFITSKKYAELKDKPLTLEELNNYPLILPAEGSNIRYNLDKFCDDLNIKLKPKIEIASHTLIVEFTKIGFGIGFATEQFIKSNLESGEIYKLNVSPKISNRYIGISILKNHSLNAASKKFIEILKQA